jgi:uronate dehydrogenase
MQLPLHRLLLTGAAGGLGKVLRPRLSTFAHTLRVSDIVELTHPAANEEIVTCDLGDFNAMLSLIDGVDAVVHLGGLSLDGPFEPILNANIRGVHNLYEAARIKGIQRIVFASSNHVVGFHKQADRLDANCTLRPDGNYGLSKAFGEMVASFYFDRYGIETVSIRIGSSFPTAEDRRMMATWLSYDDLTTLVRCALTAPKVGHTIVYGTSNNAVSWWNNVHAAHLGWTPKDSSEQFRAKVEALPPVDPKDPVAVYQGGRFVALGPYN